MKVDLMHHYMTIRRWSVGVHFFSRRMGTLVVLVGTQWKFGFGRGANSRAVMCGPLSLCLAW